MFKRVFVLFFVSFLLCACSASQHYTQQYDLAKSQYTGVPLKNSAKTEDLRQRFENVYSSMHEGIDEKKISTLYASEFYFNDTLFITNNRDELIEYFYGLHKNIESINVRVHQILVDAHNPADIFIYWEMNFKLDYLIFNKQVRSFGMSHIRVDEDNKIILQQDFWDKENGLYSAIPLSKYVK